MSTSHAKSVFANNCLSTPRKSHNHQGTQNSNHFSKEDPLNLSITPSTPYVHGIRKEKDRKVTPGSKKCPQDLDIDLEYDFDYERTEYAALFSTLLESNALLLEEIYALKQAQQAVLNSTKDDEVDKLTQSIPPQLLKDTWMMAPSAQSPAHTSRLLSVQRNNDESASCSEMVEDIEPTDPNSSGYSESVGSSIIHSSQVDPFASPGAIAVQNMWENFSVDDYKFTEARATPKKGEKEWTPKITVPEPFSMTIREAQSSKQKSRSLRMAEEEQLRRAAEEEAELMKKFRASPVPASTFLPLYELLNAKNEQRREEIKQLSKELLKANERPFSFTKRDEKLKELKAKKAKLLRQIEENEMKKSMFKAKPIPKKLFSSDANDHIQEQEEYRRIRIQMRSEQLLASSKLPGSMQLYPIKRKEQEGTEEKECLFRPNINGTIPDYDQAYYRFQKQLAAKKNTKLTTITEPFQLLTKQVLSRRKQMADDIQDDDRILSETHKAPSAKASRQSCKHTQVSAYPAQMTQTAKIRQSLAKEKLATILQNELQEQKEASERKRRAREVKQSIAKKSLLTDPTAWLEEKKRQKLKELRKIDQERQTQYQHQLNKMQERVQSRPLLLEETTIKLANKSAEANYRATLRKAGLSHQEIHSYLCDVQL